MAPPFRAVCGRLAWPSWSGAGAIYEQAFVKRQNTAIFPFHRSRVGAPSAQPPLGEPLEWGGIGGEFEGNPWADGFPSKLSVRAAVPYSSLTCNDQHLGLSRAVIPTIYPGSPHAAPHCALSGAPASIMLERSRLAARLMAPLRGPTHMYSAREQTSRIGHLFMITSGFYFRSPVHSHQLSWFTLLQHRRGRLRHRRLRQLPERLAGL